MLGLATIGLLLVPGHNMRKAVDIADVSGGDPAAVAEVQRLLRYSDTALPVPFVSTEDSPSRDASATE